METLIQRLVANPHDKEALDYAHHAGSADPRSYAIMLEKVGEASNDAGYAAHWLSEAANVWSTTIGDAHHAARTLMRAIEKDPTGSAGERLAQLYRDKGDPKALVALLEKLVKLLSPLLHERPEVRPQLASMHEELGRLWSEAAAHARPERALENLEAPRRASIRRMPTPCTRRASSSSRRSSTPRPSHVLPRSMQAIVDDPGNASSPSIETRPTSASACATWRAATQALKGSLGMTPDDATLKAVLVGFILERIDAGEMVSADDRTLGAQVFVSLAENYDGEYGMSYATSALRAAPGVQRPGAMQLADYYATQLGRVAEIAPLYAGYMQANPNGFMAGEARVKGAGAKPPPAPVPQSRPSFPAGGLCQARQRRSRAASSRSTRGPASASARRSPCPRRRRRSPRPRASASRR